MLRTAALFPALGVVILGQQAEVQGPNVGTATARFGFEAINHEQCCKKLEAQGAKFDRPFDNSASIALSSPTSRAATSS
jgi:hypothetical protein